MAGTTTEARRWNLWYEGVHPVADPTVTVLLRELKERVAGIADNGLSGRGEDVARVDQIRLLEELKAVAAAAQARLTQGLERSQLRQQELAGVSRRDLGRGIGDQVALARRCPSSKGGDHLALARAMVDMPHTLALLTRGELTEWAASLLVAETAILSAEDRRVVDERLCAMSVDARTGEILEPVAPGLTPRQAGGSARALANELDPEAAVKRAAKARRDRRVTIRPTPDTMTYVTGLLPVAQGVAAFAALRASAKASKAAGDHRTEAQIMADLFVERLTGQASAQAVPVEIQLVMTPDSLLGASERPARTADGTLVDAGTARDLAGRTDAPRWLRRIFTDPVTGAVTALDPRRRSFGAEDSRFLHARDRACRHPGCEAPIADLDHVHRFADGGETTRPNGQGLCEAHNLLKEVPGWRSRVADERPGHHTVEITTPTGHTYRSQAPPALPPPP